MTDRELNAMILEELERQETQEQAIEKIVNDLVAEASAELDEFVQTVKDYLDQIKAQSKKGNIADYSDDVLEIQCIKLPVLMYFVADKMEDWAMYSDVAKAEYQDAYDTFALAEKEKSGRVKDMELAGREGARVQDWTLKIKNRVYSKLKTKLKYAEEIFNGLRKVMSTRVVELEVFRSEQARTLGGINDNDF